MDSLDKNFLLAIGYQKTGSTWLDHHLWAHPQIGFYNVKSRALRQIIVGTRPLEFNLTHCRAQVRQRLPLIPANKMPVIGMERLCGSPHSGGYDSKEIADRLANLFPNAKVLIVIREQHQMILSTYNQSVKGGNSMTLHEYITESQSGRYAVPHFDRARFCYHHLINYYIARFGRANVLVLPYEQFCTTPRTFVEQIVRFAGITVDDALIDTLPFTQRTRTSFSPRSVTVLRQFNAWVGQRNQFTPHPILPFQLDRGRMKQLLARFEDRLPTWLAQRNQRATQIRLANIAQRTAGFYEESNAAVVRATGLDLGQYGYALPAQERPQ